MTKKVVGEFYEVGSRFFFLLIGGILILASSTQIRNPVLSISIRVTDPGLCLPGSDRPMKKNPDLDPTFEKK